MDQLRLALYEVAMEQREQKEKEEEKARNLQHARNLKIIEETNSTLKYTLQGVTNDAVNYAVRTLTPYQGIEKV